MVAITVLHSFFFQFVWLSVHIYFTYCHHRQSKSFRLIPHTHLLWFYINPKKNLPLPSQLDSLLWTCECVCISGVDCRCWIMHADIQNVITNSFLLEWLLNLPSHFITNSRKDLSEHTLWLAEFRHKAINHKIEKHIKTYMFFLHVTLVSCPKLGSSKRGSRQELRRVQSLAFICLLERLSDNL